MGGCRDLDGYLQTVPRAAKDTNVGIIGIALQSNRQVLCVEGVTTIRTNGDSIVLATNNAEIAGPKMHTNSAAGGTFHRKQTVLEILPLDFARRRTRER
jgi:hypothetical protein